jgi:hypothetical protein
VDNEHCQPLAILVHGTKKPYRMLYRRLTERLLRGHPSLCCTRLKFFISVLIRTSRITSHAVYTSIQTLVNLGAIKTKTVHPTYRKFANIPTTFLCKPVGSSELRRLDSPRHHSLLYTQTRGLSSIYKHEMHRANQCVTHT